MPGGQTGSPRLRGWSEEGGGLSIQEALLGCMARPEPKRPKRCWKPSHPKCESLQVSPWNRKGRKQRLLYEDGAGRLRDSEASCLWSPWKHDRGYSHSLRSATWQPTARATRASLSQTPTSGAGSRLGSGGALPPCGAGTVENLAIMKIMHNAGRCCQVKSS